MKNLFLLLLFVSISQINSFAAEAEVWWPKIKIKYVSGISRGETKTGEINCYGDGICYAEVSIEWWSPSNGGEDDIFLMRDGVNLVLFASKNSSRHNKDFKAIDGFVSIANDSHLPAAIMKESGFENKDFLLKAGKYLYKQNDSYHMVVLK